MTSQRQEFDPLGPVLVDSDRLWGAQTQRALLHFNISSERMPVELIHALASVKRSCAKVNGDLGLLPMHKVRSIMVTTEEIMAGTHDAEFPLSVWQTGSGTQTHMNMNEVLANRASEHLAGPRGPERLVHPNDDVNLGQSSNDVFPTAMHVAAALGISTHVLPALDELQASLQEKSQAFSGIVKLGRTHLQDATPITLGQEFSGYAAQLANARQLIQGALSWLYPLAIGGTAVGSGANTHPQFGARELHRLGRHELLRLQVLRPRELALGQRLRVGLGAFTQQHKREQRRHSKHRRGDQHGHRHEFGWRPAMRLRPQHVGQAQTQRQQ